MTELDSSAANADETSGEFDSAAWLMVGLTRNRCGWLACKNGSLAFADEDGEVVFSAPLSEVSDVKVPWYYFGGGLKLTVGERRYRISFVRPGDASDISNGRALTAAWRELLTADRS